MVVYLDTPVNKTIENIKTRGTDYEINSKALTPEFLQCMENLHKEKYLRESEYEYFVHISFISTMINFNNCDNFSIPGEVLIADFSEEEDVENIIEDIENIDFDSERDLRDPKFTDWRKDEWWQDYHRYL